MPNLLGIDTGGTYTDAVLFDEEKGILAVAKSPTTSDDLTIGIKNAVQKILLHEKPHINLVSLSSTLATNAVVEGKGSPAALILIGYDPDILENETFKEKCADNPVILIRGGHRISGDEQEPLDRNALIKAIDVHAKTVSAFAVSGYFGVRNPSHELSAKAIIRERTGFPVTCGHELTTSLDAPRRAVTSLLNARLIPLIHTLIDSVTTVLSDLEISAPLMIVKGDGSLISAKTSLDVPIETIMSGPAASVVGARYLTGLSDALVIDMGGTTSDMAVLKGGAVVFSEQDTAVGDFQPMVSSIDMMTEGIGGDSAIQVISSDDLRSGFRIGPERVLPLCVLGKRFPEILEMMNNDIDNARAFELPLFVLKSSGAPLKKDLPASCNELIQVIDKAPLFVPRALETAKHPSVYAQSIDYLLKEGLLIASSFTPTDAVNVLGDYHTGSTEAAGLGAELMAARLDKDVILLCRETVGQVRYALASAMIRCALGAEDVSGKMPALAADSFFVDRAIKNSADHLINCSISLGCPIIAVGAPAETYLPGVATLLNCDIEVPENSAVANAIGAVTGTISQTVRILIKPQHGGKTYRVYSPEGLTEHANYEDAKKIAIQTATRIAGQRATEAGAGKIAIDLSTKNLGVKNKNSGRKEESIIQTEIKAIAVGRPRMGA